MEKVTWSWSNYLKTSPDNIQYLALSIKAIIAGIGGTTLLMEADKWVTFWILLAGLILDEVAKFAGKAAHDQHQISVKFPAGVADQVTVSEESIEEKPKT